MDDEFRKTMDNMLATMSETIQKMDLLQIQPLAPQERAALFKLREQYRKDGKHDIQKVGENLSLIA